MKFSIITPTFNSCYTLKYTIKSVFNQTYSNIELIVVDGNSKDGTKLLLENTKRQVGSRLQWICENDDGIYDAMNKGFAMASGDVISVLNADDFYENANVISAVANCFATNRDIDAVYADLYYVSKRDTSQIVRHWISGKQRPFRYGWHPAHPTFYAKREVYEKYGVFDLEFKLAADFELMLRLVEKHHIKLYYLQEPLVRMRLGGATSKNLTNIFKGNKECIRAFKKNDLPVSFLYPFYRLLPKLRQFFH